MNKVWILLSLVLILSSCSNKKNATIRVEVNDNLDNGITLEQLGFSKSTLIDSASVSSGRDRVTFKVKKLEEPTFLILGVKEKGTITLLTEPGEKIFVRINSTKPFIYDIEGSKGSVLTTELSNRLNESKHSLDSLYQLYSISTERDIKRRIGQEYQNVIDSQRAYSTRFIWANTMSRASVMALYQKYDENNYVFDKADDIKLFKAVASSLMAFYPESEYTKGMIADIDRMQKVINTAKIKEMIDQSANTIPEIALPNTVGDTIKLSSLKGKVILLGFWASNDQASLMDNRELLQVYKQFKAKGFEVFQVSLDENRDEWVNAIQAADLPWINVCELNPNGSLTAKVYNIQQLPANYLISKDHTIIGKNLFGGELIKRLKEIL